MTANERLRAALEAAESDPNYESAPLAVTMMHFASAIRAAENDALERAAMDVDGVRLDAPHGDWHSACRYIAKRIRSLKSKEQP